MSPLVRSRLLGGAFLLFALWQVPPAVARLWGLSDGASLADRRAALTMTPDARLARGLGRLGPPYEAILRLVPTDANVVVCLRPGQLTPRIALGIDGRIRQPLVSLLGPRRVLLLLLAGEKTMMIPEDADSYLGERPFYLLELESLGSQPWEDRARVIAEGKGFRLWRVQRL